jgi:hypothetical protein
MGDVQKWIDALRAGKVVGRIVLKNWGEPTGAAKGARAVQASAG